MNHDETGSFTGMFTSVVERTTRNLNGEDIEVTMRPEDAEEIFHQFANLFSIIEDMNVTDLIVIEERLPGNITIPGVCAWITDGLETISNFIQSLEQADASDEEDEEEDWSFLEEEDEYDYSGDSYFVVEE